METLRTLANLGVNYRDAGRLEAAIPLLEEAQRAVKKYPELGYVTRQLLETYTKAGEIARRADLLQEIVNGMKTQPGRDHPDTLEAMNQLGVLYWQSRQLDKSVPVFEELLKAREAKLGRDHVQTMSVAANLGVNYKDAGRLAEAIPLLEEAYRAAKKYPALVWVGTQLLDGYAAAGKTTEANKLFPELLADVRRLPENSPPRAQQLVALGRWRLRTGAFAEAEPLLRESLAIYEKTQPDGWERFTTQSLLGGALLDLKKYAEAQPLLLKGYEGMKQREKMIPPNRKIRIPEALDRLIELYTATDMPDEVRKWRAERAKYPSPHEVAPPPREKK